MTKDYTPTEPVISMHGLGFIQVKLENGERLHVWHPDLPRRKCAAHSPIHNHRFAAEIRVVHGTQHNQYHYVERVGGEDAAATHHFINHDGPRLPSGSRKSFVDGLAQVTPGLKQRIAKGESYHIPPWAYHSNVRPEREPSGFCATIMRKLWEGGEHANSLIEIGHTFDQDFNRFAMSAGELFSYVLEVAHGSDWSHASEAFASGTVGTLTRMMREAVRAEREEASEREAAEDRVELAAVADTLRIDAVVLAGAHGFQAHMGDGILGVPATARQVMYRDGRVFEHHPLKFEGGDLYKWHMFGGLHPEGAKADVIGWR